jgi:hypothetical protein
MQLFWPGAAHFLLSTIAKDVRVAHQQLIVFRMLLAAVCSNRDVLGSPNNTRIASSDLNRFHIVFRLCFQMVCSNHFTYS